MTSLRRGEVVIHVARVIFPVSPTRPGSAERSGSHFHRGGAPPVPAAEAAGGTGPTGALIADDLPYGLEAVTTTRRSSPGAGGPGTYVEPTAPAIIVQLTPSAERSHWYENEPTAVVQPPTK